MPWVPYEDGSPHKQWVGAWPAEDESIVIDTADVEVRSSILVPLFPDDGGYDWSLRD